MLRFAVSTVVVGLIVPGFAAAQIGTGSEFCAANPNSTGLVTTLSGSFGSGVGSDLHLEVTQGVPNEIGYFLAGNEATAGVPTSNGMLCLVGTGTAQLFRYSVVGSASNSVGLFDSAGVMQNMAGTSLIGSGFDVPNTIPGSMPIPILSGETWHFQVWHRDTVAGLGDSNFSNGLSVTFGGSQAVPEMVSITAGSFVMGSDVASGAPYFGVNAHRPAHGVTLTEDFWMGKYEVTQSQFQGLMGYNPSFTANADLPVERVSWHDAMAYCAALTAQETALGTVPPGMEYRLPTEAEWEFACRAGSTTEFSTGNDLFCTDANIGFSFHNATQCTGGTSLIGGSYPANALGLHDMHGNVWEWCLDSANDYFPIALVDPFTGGGSNRMIRGGSWRDFSNYCRSASRIDIPAVDSYITVGFRIVLGPILVP